MANNNIDEQMVKESLECPICKDFFEEPKQLLCGHTFCNTCIARLDKITIPGTRCYEFDDHYNLVYGNFFIKCNWYTHSFYIFRCRIFDSMSTMS